MEIESDGRHHCIDAVAVASFEIIAVHSMLGLHVTDDGLDRGSAFHLAFDGDSGSPNLPGDPDPVFVRVVMAAIPLVDMGTLDLDTGILLDIGDGGVECMAIEGITVQRAAVKHELTAFGSAEGVLEQHW